MHNETTWWRTFFIVFVIASSVIYSVKSWASECTLTPHQESVMHMSYSLGEPYDLGLTMVAIAMRESSMGEVMINLNDPSAGTHHATIDKAITELGWPDTSYNRNRATQLMMTDLVFGAELGLDTLLWWNDYHEGNWRQTVSSYNGGFRGNPVYVKHITNNIKTIRKCGWLERSDK